MPGSRPGRRFASPCCAVLLSAVLLGAALLGTVRPARATEIDQGAEYRACMALVKTQPNNALEKALAMGSLGGGMAAEHCRAAALMALGRYDDAATRLEKLATSPLLDLPVKAHLYAQAGEAWFLAGKPDKATRATSAAIGLQPRVSGYYIDRAQDWAARKDYAAAEADLSVALNLAPSNADAFALRASARRYLGKNDDALADANTALELQPNNPDALLERGILYRLAGKKDKARADWLRILNGMPDSTAAGIARKNLELMDVAGEEPAAAPTPKPAPPAEATPVIESDQPPRR